MMSTVLGSAIPHSIVLLFVQCVPLFLLLIYIAAQQTNAESQQQQQQQQQEQHLTASIESFQQPLDAAGIELHRSLRFEPAVVDFGQWPVGTAHSHTVTLVNHHVNRSVYLTSVSGRTPSFYSSFFENKVIAPLSNTTFQVVFLPRDNGAVHTELFIHSSFGQARIPVRGEGRECPYRLNPLTGIKAPLNATLTPEITMYNPHDKPLQILEVYSSGGQFQLELPSGGQEGPQALWAIPPFTQKPVIRIRFHGRSAGNFSAYVRIKISHELSSAAETVEEVLVMPVEFEILSQTGLYAQNPVIDFGRLSTDNGNRDVAPKIKLQLRQSNERRPHDFLGFNMRVLSGLFFDPNDNSITLDARKVNQTLVLDETVLLRAAYKRNISALQEFTVRLRAHIYKGGLFYKENATTFLTHANSSQKMEERQRQFMVRNDFKIPLAIFNVSITPPLNLDVFDLQLAAEFESGPAILAPGAKLLLLHLKVLNDSIPYSSMLRVFTNISSYELPLAVCSGRLHVVGHNVVNLPLDAAYNASLHLGAIPNVDISHQGWITLVNRNPTTIRFKDWHFDSPRGLSFQVALMGCVRQADKLLKGDKRYLPIETVDFRFCNQVVEGDVAIFEVALQEYMAENTAGVLNIWTPFEHIKIAVKFHAWKGKIELVQEKVHFPDCFPGKSCSSDIYITSGLSIPITLGSVEFNNDYFKFRHINNTEGALIEPRKVTKIGRVYFEAEKVCPTRCYIPPYDKATNKRIAFPGPRPNKSGGSLLFDELELRRRTELFRQLKWYFQTVVFTLTTRQVYQFQIPMPIFSEWPKLVRGGRQHLPLVEVGKPHIHHIKVFNPADVPLLVDYVISDPKAPNAAHLSLPLEVMDLSASCLLTNKPVFSLATPTLREPVIIPPNGSINVPIRFESTEVETYCTLLHLRNNLTLYEPVWISAKTVQPQFRFGNRKPGNTTPMMFEIKETHLIACHEEYPPMPLVAVKRTFTARNAGELPIFIQNFHIGEYACEGYGFKILDCQSFELQANSSRKVEISFTPDFSLSRVQRPLILRTNLSTNEFQYELLATLPPVNMEVCAKKLPRPAWERSVRNAVMMLLASTFIFVILATHIDYTNIICSQALLLNMRQSGPIYPIFNLRNIIPRPFQPKDESEDASVERLEESVANAENANTSQSQPRQANNHHNSSNGSSSKRRGRKSSTQHNSPNVTVGPVSRNISLSDLSSVSLPRDAGNALEASLLQNLIIMSNNPNDNRVIVVAPTRRDSTPPPSATPPMAATSTPNTNGTLSCEKQPLAEACLAPLSPNTTASSTTATTALKSLISTPPKKKDGDKENDRESGISLSSTTSNEMESRSNKKKHQQHMSRAKRSKLLAIDKKAEKERHREKLRERQLEKERERDLEKSKATELEEKQEEREREREKEKQEREKVKEREKRERDKRFKEQLEKEAEALEKQRQQWKEAAELEKQKELEKQQQKELELKELERQQALEEQRQQEMERQKELELQKELERKKQRELELEKERKKEVEREKRQKERERELLERKRQKEMERKMAKEAEKKRKEKEKLLAEEAMKAVENKGEEQASEMMSSDDKTPPLNGTGKESTRKYGKTPGRERRKEGKENENSKEESDTQQAVEQRKLKNKAVQALVFDAKESNGQLMKMNGNNNHNNSSGSESASPSLRTSWEAGNQVYLGDIMQPRQREMEMIAMQSETHIMEDKEKIANELGPIGSRKSPSSTPLWESVQKQQQQHVENLQMPKPSINSNSSFFSNLSGNSSPNLNSFGLGEGQFMGISTNLYELQKVQMELQRQLQTNELIINLHQQQQLLQHQQELLQGAGEIAAAAAATMESGNQWPTNNAITAWSPMGYRPAVGLNVIGGAGNQNQHTNAANNTNNNNNNNMNNSELNLRMNGNSAPWQQFGLTRPPPGLNASPNHMQQQNRTVQSQQQLQTAHFQQQAAVQPQQQQQQQQQNQQPQQQHNQAEMPQFDPFRSWSSIWSENWQ